MRLTIALFALCLLAVSCKKNNPAQNVGCEPVISQSYSNDTIFPSDYLVAYPGSWWEYNDGFIDSCTSWEAVPFRTTTISGECIFVDEDYKILPEGLLYANNVSFDQRVSNSGGLNSTRCTPLFDTIVGTFYNESYGSGSGIYASNNIVTAETLERLPSMTIGSNTYYDVIHVIHTREVQFGHWGGGGPTFLSEYWFAKDVGMVKMMSGDSGSITDDIELVNHYIAPH